MQKISAASAERLLKLGQEWEAHRVPLVAKYRRAKQLLQERKEGINKKVAEIRRFREGALPAAVALPSKRSFYRDEEQVQ